eukprot:m.239199 g.239199  ORF g.239199 m.239199 type:complete len:370 (-) comp13444_c0_seq1:1-1110(-)
MTSLLANEIEQQGLIDTRRVALDALRKGLSSKALIRGLDRPQVALAPRDDDALHLVVLAAVCAQGVVQQLRIEGGRALRTLEEGLGQRLGHARQLLLDGGNQSVALGLGELIGKGAQLQGRECLQHDRQRALGVVQRAGRCLRDRLGLGRDGRQVDLGGRFAAAAKDGQRDAEGKAAAVQLDGGGKIAAVDLAVRLHDRRDLLLGVHGQELAQLRWLALERLDRVVQKLRLVLRRGRQQRRDDVLDLALGLGLGIGDKVLAELGAVGLNELQPLLLVDMGKDLDELAVVATAERVLGSLRGNVGMEVLLGLHGRRWALLLVVGVLLAALGRRHDAGPHALGLGRRGLRGDRFGSGRGGGRGIGGGGGGG